MTILISYDKFTQCNKDLAEHQFANCVLKLCNNTSLAKIRIKKKPKPAKATGKWSYAGSSELFFFFKDIYAVGSHQIGKYVLRTLTSWHVSASLLEWRGIQCSIALRVGCTPGTSEVLGSAPDFDFYFFFFEGKLLTWFVLVIAVSVLHGCIVSLSILFPAQALQSHGGARVAGQRLSEALVCWLHLPRATVCPELTTEGKRQRAVNNPKCIWILVFSGTPILAERVQQQTGILPWPGLCLLFPNESNNELWACAFLPVSCLQTESREVAQLYQAAHGHLQCIEPLWPNAKIFLFLSFSLFHYICRKSCCSTVL